MTGKLKIGFDGKPRCLWPGDLPDYLEYHDHEWGIPVADDYRLFEKICLEGFQSGLSWLTILRKRENFRQGFANFNFEQVARFGQRDVEKLLRNPGIVRHRKKIESTINNAKQACQMMEEFGTLAAFFWRYEPDASQSIKANNRNTDFTPNSTTDSEDLSRDLKKRGWSFIGPTTAYAFMQAMGMVNDHTEGCFARELTNTARRQFSRPA
ncbi:MAG: DNA-3-methyladenine glycosylase I [Pseudomonadota bacterium]|nr:DNA-3-methyladenine glycosylase I [Pseudomonadota bacterium]